MNFVSPSVSLSTHLYDVEAKEAEGLGVYRPFFRGIPPSAKKLLQLLPIT